MHEYPMDLETRRRLAPQDWSDKEVARGLRIEQGVKEKSDRSFGYHWVKLTPLTTHGLGGKKPDAVMLLGCPGDSLWQELADLFTNLAKDPDMPPGHKDP